MNIEIIADQLRIVIKLAKLIRIRYNIMFIRYNNIKSKISYRPVNYIPDGNSYEIQTKRQSYEISLLLRTTTSLEFGDLITYNIYYDGIEIMDNGRTIFIMFNYDNDNSYAIMLSAQEDFTILAEISQVFGNFLMSYTYKIPYSSILSVIQSIKV